MTKTNDYEVLSVDAARVLRCLPAMGRLMLTANRLGVTHERMGLVERVSAKDGKVHIGGAEHESLFDPAEIGTIIVDRTGKMKDQVYPRVVFQDRAGDVIVSAVGLEGLAPFDAGLAPLGSGEARAQPEKPESSKAELSEGDPGEAPFAAACAAGVPVCISFHRPGLEQSWTGVIDAVKPAMGFINVMRPDFHMHLRGGAVARWRKVKAGDATQMIAQNAEGQDIGLIISSQTDCFNT